jgi:hypothetical protein
MPCITLNAVQNKLRKPADDCAEFNCFVKGNAGSAHFRVNIDQNMQRLSVAENISKQFDLIN